VKIVLLIFLSFYFFTPVSFSSEKTFRVLYINSYHRGYSWSDDIESGLIKTLKDSDLNIEISTEYLDNLRFSSGENHKANKIALENKYKHYTPDIIITSDNAAFDLIKLFRSDKRQSTPFVFSGYNGYSTNTLTGLKNTTGIVENIDLTSGTEFATNVFPDTDTLAFIFNTDDASGISLYNYAIKHSLPELTKKYKVETLVNLNQLQVKNRLNTLSKNTLVFMPGKTSGEGDTGEELDSRRLNQSEHARIVTDSSPFPVFTFWKYHINNGVLGGEIMSGYSQGIHAATSAISILNGVKASDIPVMALSATEKIIDFKLLKKFDLSKSDIPLSASFINSPVSIWQTSKFHFTLFLIILITLAIALVFTISKNSHLRRIINLKKATISRYIKDLNKRLVEIKTLQDQALDYSYQDPLTNLSNRRKFNKQLEEELITAHRFNYPLSLFMIDIDHFKLFNDFYGHVIGDQCLASVAKAVASCAHRPKDLTARYGGEEFVIILPNTPLSSARIIAKRILTIIAALEIEHKGIGENSNVSVSIGGITLEPGSEYPCSEKAIIGAADKLLYESKETGRNKSTLKVIRELPKVANIDFNLATK
jgi:diguanylate cyclase (GGDEF)-like protein